MSLKNGDLFVNSTGSRWSGGIGVNTYKIYEYRKNEEHGLGFQYTRGGSSHGHYWCKPNHSMKIESISDSILHSFLHGSDIFELDESIEITQDNINSIIESSDFKFICEDEIKACEVIESCKNVIEASKHFDLIKKYGCNHKMHKWFLGLIGYEIGEFNGAEIGEFLYQVGSLFMSNIDNIENTINNKG